jgi:hypothetical protein
MLASVRLFNATCQKVSAAFRPSVRLTSSTLTDCATKLACAVI